MKRAVSLLVCVMLCGVCRAQADEYSWNEWVDIYTAPLTTPSERVLLHQVPVTRQPFVKDSLWELWGKESGMGDDFSSHYQALFSLVVGRVDGSHQEKIVSLMRTSLLFGVPERVYLMNRRPVRHTSMVHLGLCTGMPPLEVWQWKENNPLLVFVGRDQVRWRGLISELVASSYGLGRIGGSNIPFCFRSSPIFDVLQHVSAPLVDEVLNAPYTHELYQQRFVQAVSRVRALTTFRIRDVVSLHRVDNGVRVALSLLLSRDEYEWRVEQIGAHKRVMVDVKGVLVAEDGSELKRGYRFMCPYDTNFFFFEFSDDELVLKEGNYHATFTVFHYNSVVGKATVSFVVPPPRDDVVLVKATATPSPERIVKDAFPFRMEVDAIDVRYVAGTVKVEAVTPRVNEVSRVCFFKNQDSTPVYCKQRAPFEGYIEMGDIPEPTTLSAVAYDDIGETLASSSLAVNTFRSPTALKLKPFRSDDLQGNRVALQGYATHPSSKTCRELKVFQNNVLRNVYDCDVLKTGVFSLDLKLDAMDAFPAHVVRVCMTFRDETFAEDVTVVSSGFSSQHEVSVVELPVFVTRHGAPVLGLSRNDFSVQEDGITQELRYVFQDDAPVRAGIVLDVSASVGDTLVSFKETAFSFVQRLLHSGQDNKVMIARFASHTRVVTDVVGYENLDEVAHVLSLVSMTSGRTALYDAISAMVAELHGTSGKRAIIIFTDGRENASGDADVFARSADVMHTSSAALRAQRAQYRASADAFEKLSLWLAHSSVVLYLIQYSDQPISEQMRQDLTAVAALTGGKAFFLTQVSELPEVYEEIIHGLETGYLLVYTPSHPCAKECGHAIQVHVDSALQVRAPASRHEGMFD